jgi:hypothetical protein
VGLLVASRERNDGKKRQREGVGSETFLAGVRVGNPAERIAAAENEPASQRVGGFIIDEGK